MYKSIPTFSRVITILTVVTTLLFSVYKGGFLGLILSAVIWAFGGFMLPRLKLLDLSNYFVFYGLLIATAVVAVSAPFITDKLTTQKESNETETTTEEDVTNSDLGVLPTNEPNEDGSIVVEAGDGLLGGDVFLSYIGESARGKEAYLADGGVTATYVVETTVPGQYQLWVKINDDGLHLDGARNAKVTVNTSQVGQYNHVSQEIDGWKWVEISTFTLLEGDNTVIFEKIETTTAAFVMDEFKFVQVN
ncbi:MAG TPA: hypothetical protein PK863_00225 [Candidatus Dojkabacteria bacterium]|nr:hypothetical protein [Candidatus Dojkabacteria bacterium]HRP51110.1 hypothetical protein [Candidatus Dojkabacteria bacterium]